jgi:hypothetical protein
MVDLSIAMFEYQKVPQLFQDKKKNRNMMDL